MVQTTLPVHLTRFIGRGKELDDLVPLVARARLVTLTGAGGSGKTRLAREMALRIGDTFERTAWVDLAPLTDSALIAEQIGSALDVPERSDKTPLESLVEAVGTSRALIVLDNCEHLVAGCAALAESLLRACPALSVVATSREALGIAGETAWLVPPLAGAEAVQLFVERAQAALPSFQLSDANGAAIAEICRRLDGLPLAIELAAARVRVLSPDQIAQRLGDAFRLLTTGSRTGLPRHRTLRATMEWSFNLLGTGEQVLLTRLSVFAGSFTLEAAEAVAAGEPLETDDILDGVAALVDKSLVLMEAGDGIARYRLLETVRQYGHERLDQTGERVALERRFAEYFLEILEASAPTLVGGSNDLPLLARLVAELDNLRAASVWAVAEPERSELGLRYVGVLFWFWYALGLFREARQITDRALANAPADAPILLRGRALFTSAITALAQGEYARSCKDFEAALPLLREANDATGTATAMAKYGASRLLGGDVDGAVAMLDEAVALTRDWSTREPSLIFAIYWRAWAAYVQGQYDLAYELVAKMAQAGREHGLPTTLAHATATMARFDFARGHVEEAGRLMVEALEREIAINDGWGVGIALDVFALVAGKRGNFEDATKLLAGNEAHRARLAMALPGPGPTDREGLEAAARKALGARFDVLYTEGLKLSTAETVQLAFDSAARHTGEHPVVQAAEQRQVQRARLRVLALGPLQVFVDGRTIDSSAWGSARPRELLVYLLLHPEGRTKEQVGLAFWPDASPDQLRNSFHVTLHRLRKALGGPDWVTLTNDRYRVAPELIDEFDALVFEREVTAARQQLKRQAADALSRLEEALGRFRGDLLDGEPVGDWHLEFRDRFQRLYVDSLMDLGARLVKEKRHEKAAEAYRRVLSRDDVHEEALQALMRCHAALGDRGQALKLYRRFADRLKAELEAEPRAETVRLFEKLQQGAGV